MSLFRKKAKPIFSETETGQLVNAIRDAELQTSGEVRVYVERRCKYVDAIDRARQIFDGLEMEKTKLRNGVLFYLASEDRQLAIFADKGIHKAAGSEYWQQTLDRLINTIRTKDLVSGLCTAIREIGITLSEHFPYEKDTDKNELPDDIVFGK